MEHAVSTLKDMTHKDLTQRLCKTTQDSQESDRSSCTETEHWKQKLSDAFKHPSKLVIHCRHQIQELVKDSETVPGENAEDVLQYNASTAGVHLLSYHEFAVQYSAD